MQIALLGSAFLASLAFAVVMGYAIQRGATCTVLAVSEAVNRRRFTRLSSMLEASLWVLGGLLAAHSLHVLPAMPAGYAVNVVTIIGGVLLGAGAYVAGACVFGAVARLGSGEWAYAATPLGFYAGCVVFGHVPSPPPVELADASPILSAPAWIAALLLALLVARLAHALRHAVPAGVLRKTSPGGAAAAAREWSPHAATIVIGIAFFFMLMLVGAWTYTDALAELARGMAGAVVARTVLFFGLLAGAIMGGWTAGRLRSIRIATRQVARCFLGGALMAWGTSLIPGGNDGLVLVGMPLLWPYAWLAFLSMCGTIVAAQLLEKAFGSPLAPPARTP